MLTSVPLGGGDPKHVEKEPLGVVMSLVARHPHLREQLQLYFAQPSNAGIFPEVSHRQNTDTNLVKNDLIFFSERSENSETSQTMPERPSNMSVSSDDISDIFFRTNGPGILPVSPGKGAFSSVVAAPGAATLQNPSKLSHGGPASSRVHFADQQQPSSVGLLIDGLPTPSFPASAGPFQPSDCSSNETSMPLLEKVLSTPPPSQLGATLAPSTPSIPHGTGSPPGSGASSSAASAASSLPSSPRLGGPPLSATSQPSPSHVVYRSGEFEVVFCFGETKLKQSSLMKPTSLALPSKLTFSGESATPLFDLVNFVVSFADFVDQRGWDQKAASVILRSNITGPAGLLVTHRPEWKPLLDVLFATYSTPDALRRCRREVDKISMQPGESISQFFKRVHMLLKVFREGRSDHELAAWFIDALRPHLPGFPVETQACWFALETLYHNQTASLNLVQSILLQYHLQSAQMVRKTKGEKQKPDKPGPSTKSDRSTRCYDCGKQDVKIGHQGCATPGARKFKPADKDAKASPGPKPDSDKGKPNATKQTVAKKAKAVSFADPLVEARPEADASPNAMISLTCENGQRLIATVDSAATCHFLPPAEVDRLNLTVTALLSPERADTAKPGTYLTVTAKATGRFFVGDQLISIEFCVSPEIGEPLLGFRAWLKTHPNTTWTSSPSGEELLQLSGVTFVVDPTSDGHLWVPSVISSAEFMARASLSSGEEQKDDRAMDRTRFAMMVARCPDMFLPDQSDPTYGRYRRDRPLTHRELMATSSFSSKKEYRRAYGRLLDQWGDYMYWSTRTLDYKIENLDAWLKVLMHAVDNDHLAVLWAECLDGVPVEDCTTDWTAVRHKARRVQALLPTAPAMQRTTHADTASLERLLADMRNGGASEQDCAFFENEIFWPYERLRLQSLGKPPKSRGPDLDFDIKVDDKLPTARFFRQRPRTMSEAEKKIVFEYANQQVALGLGRFASPSEASCISNWVFAPKSDGSVRPCGGFVQLNNMTQLDRSFVPTIQDVFSKLNDTHQVFFTTDVEAAFQAIPATERAQRMMATWMPDGRVFIPNTMLWGTKNAPPTFQKNIEAAIQSVSDATSYVDDVHSGGVDWMSMLLVLRDTCEALHQHGFYLSFRKTYMGSEVPLLGYRRTRRGLEADPKRLEEIRSLPSPVDKTQLRSQIAMMRWFAPFVEGNATFHGLAEALGYFDPMTAAKARWVWDDVTERKWRDILALLAHVVALSRPDFSRDFFLDTDASKIGWGYVLYQVSDDGSRRILRIGSKPFKGSMADAAPVHQEAHALINAFVECEDLLAYTHVRIRTDHRPLVWLLKSAEVSPRLWGGKAVRWVLYLQNFSWTLEHVAGESNVAPDALSRMHWPDSLEVSRSLGNSKAAKAARRKPVQIQRRLDEDGVAGMLDDSPPPLVIELDDDDDDVPEYPAVPQFPGPPVGLNVDVFEDIAVALLRDQPVPVMFEDPRFSPVIALVRKWLSELELRSDRLFHKTLGVYVRLEERDAVMFQAHKAADAGHLGFAKTLERLRGRAWWPTLRADLGAYVTLCGICQRSKHHKAVPADVKPLPVAAVFERVHLDLMGPFPPSGPQQFRYIFTAKDAGTKYVVIRPLCSKEASEVMTIILTNICLVFGFPASIVSDQGSEFVNNLNEAIWSQIAINHRATAPYHPASNGLVERCHVEVNFMLRAMSHPDQSDWAQMLPFVEFALNTASSSTTLLTPFFLVFGRHPYTTLDLRLDLPRSPSVPVASFLNNLYLARELAANRDGRARKVDPAPRSRKVPALKVGDFVLVRFSGAGEGKSVKLSPIFQGPFRVVAVRDGNTATLVNVRNDKDRIERHFDRLVRFHGLPHEVEGQDEWEISTILDETIEGADRFFLVRWTGFPPGSDSWVHESDLHAPDLLREWRVSHPLRSTAAQPKSSKSKRKARKKNNAETVFVERVVAHRGSGEDGVLFQVAVGEDCGPDDYIWVRQEQVVNPEVLVAYQQALARQPGEVSEIID
jgi:transposase InsO family protein